VHCGFEPRDRDHHDVHVTTFGEHVREVTGDGRATNDDSTPAGWYSRPSGA
jgi:hypothetical protein